MHDANTPYGTQVIYLMPDKNKPSTGSDGLKSQGLKLKQLRN